MSKNIDKTNSRVSKGLVIFSTTMSLDGFIAGPNDDMDWIFKYNYPEIIIKQIIDSTGALVVGRRTYNVGKKDPDKPTGKAFEGAWHGPQFVLTHNIPPNEPDRSITFIEGDIRKVVDKALQAAKGKNVLILGANIAKQCIEQGILDEIFIQLVPVLLGNGVQLFSRIGIDYVNLEPILVETTGKIISLRYKIIK